MVREELSDIEKQRVVNLASCGVDFKNIAKEYRVGKELINEAVDEYIKEGKVPKRENTRFIFGINQYLATTDAELKEKIRKYVFEPIAKKVYYKFITWDVVRSPEHRLFRAAFGINLEERLPKEVPFEISQDKILADIEDYIENRKGKIKSIQDIYYGVINEIKEDYKRKSQGLLSQDTKEIFKNALDTLRDREKKVLEYRFGLIDGQPRTLEEVGEVFRVNRERIRQIEAKALRNLRHPTRSRKLTNIFDYETELEEIKRRGNLGSVYDRVMKVIDDSIKGLESVIEQAKIKEKPITPVNMILLDFHKTAKDSYVTLLKRTKRLYEEADINVKAKEEGEIGTKYLTSLFSTPITELELSIRSANCMRESNIRTVGELVKRKEEDLLNLRNFGKKSLAEIKGILEKMGLSLGLNLQGYE